jgi:hypothetical protein
VLVEAIHGHVVGLGVHEEHAGVVDEDVEPPVAGDVDAGPGVLFHLDVAGERRAPTSVLLDRAGNVVDRIAGQPVDEHRGALADEPAADGLSDTGAPAGDDGDLPEKTSRRTFVAISRGRRPRAFLPRRRA